MRIQAKQYEVYTLDEVKDKAIEKQWDINVDYEWWDCIYMDAEDAGLKLEYFGLDRNLHCTGKFIEDALHTADAIIKSHGASCDTYKLAESFLAERDKIVNTAPKNENGEFEDEYELDSQLDDLEDQFLKDLLYEYAWILQREYEYLTSCEAIYETLQANGYEFYADGSIA